MTRAFERNDVVGHSLLEFIAPEHRADVAAIPQRMGPGAELETEVVDILLDLGDRVEAMINDGRVA